MMRSRVRQFTTLAAACGSLLLLFALAGISQQSANEPTEILDLLNDEAALKEFLKAPPPKEPEEALKTFETLDGFRMELVAYEPMVNDPIAAAFDENGRLYVTEMRDYPYQPAPGEKALGRVRLLEDTDGDGRFDRSHIFAEDLLWPSGVAPWKQGVFVAATPDIWYLKDTDGDGKADVRQKVYTGFGLEGEQYMLNNLQWSVNHWIYGATAGNGGTIRPGDAPAAEPISVNGRDFRFDPVSGRFATTTRTFQFGNTFDDWYNRFVCNQGMPARHAVLPGHYLDRNPHLINPANVNALVQGQTRVYKISPTEGWRAIRHDSRVAVGFNPENNSVSHDYVTAGAGVTVYRGNAYPEKYRGNLFLGESTGNLVHRRVLTTDGVTFQSHREDENTEFVRSIDNWFRPVNFVNAPDGTLYVLDMSREITESIHIREDVIKHLNLTSGRDRGRIYRMAPPGFKSSPAPQLGSATTAQLVAELENSNGWNRETAHRLLYERQDKAAVAPLRRILQQSSMPLARLHALWSLAGLEALTDGDIAAGLSDGVFGVREHAVRLAESRFSNSKGLFDKVLSLAGDPNPRVRLQAALSLGEAKDPRVASGLARIARRDVEDSWVRTAVLSSSTGVPDALFAELVKDRTFVERDAGVPWLEQLAQVVGARNKSSEVQRVLTAAATGANLSSNATAQQAIVIGLAEGLRKSGGLLSSAFETSPRAARMGRDLMARAGSTATDSQVPAEKRLDAIRLLRYSSYSQVKETLAALVAPKQPHALQMGAVDALATYSDPDVASVLIKPWAGYSPELRGKVLQGLLSQEEWTLTLLKAIENGQVAAVEIDPTRRKLLTEHANGSIRDYATRLFGAQEASPREEAVAQYRAALALTGDRRRGEEIYQRECSICHRLGTTEHPLGPNLVGGSYKDPDAFLVNILDPNRYLAPQYVQYIVRDREGRVHTGMIRAETATSITLQQGESTQADILRSNIAQITSTGQSLMPEGLESRITQQEMADLIEFVTSMQYELGTRGGMIEPK